MPTLLPERHRRPDGLAQVCAELGLMRPSADDYQVAVFGADMVDPGPRSDVWINLLEFDEKPLDLPSGHWIGIDVFRRVAFSARTTRREFVSAVVDEFDRLQAVLGDTGFRDEWGYDFPHEQVEALRYRIGSQ